LPGPVFSRICSVPGRSSTASPGLSALEAPVANGPTLALQDEEHLVGNAVRVGRRHAALLVDLDDAREVDPVIHRVEEAGHVVGVAGLMRKAR